MQYCVQIYLGYSVFNRSKLAMLHEIHNSEVPITKAFNAKTLFTLSDIDMNKFFIYLNKKALAIAKDIRSDSAYTPEDIGLLVYQIYDDIADMYVFSREVHDNWMLIANECNKNLNIIYCASTEFMFNDIPEVSLLQKILSIENGPGCAENTCNVIVACGSKIPAAQLNKLKTTSNTIYMGFDGCVQIYGRDVYKKRSNIKSESIPDTIPISVDEFNTYFPDNETILINFINIYFDCALKRYYNKFNTDLLVESIKRSKFIGLKKKIQCGRIKCEADPHFIEFYQNFYTHRIGKGKYNKTIKNTAQQKKVENLKSKKNRRKSKKSKKT